MGKNKISRPLNSNTKVRRKGFPVFSNSQDKTYNSSIPLPRPPLYKICLKKKYKELKAKHKQVQAGEVDEESFMPCCYLDLEDIFSVIEFLIQSNT